MIKQYLAEMYTRALLANDNNVLKALKITGPHKIILDIGCWDGEKTLQMAKHAKAKKILGMELVGSAVKEARKKGIEVFEKQADKDKWPYKDGSIDCVVSNQVVEHLTDLDHYFSEAYRVLKQGGILITSTNNLSSWHNIIALLFGWAPFDLTNSSKFVGGIGNPLAVHRGEVDERGGSWTHKCIYTAKWLNEWQKVYGFNPVKVLGAGYYPFPAYIGRFLSLHCAFITLINKK